MTTMEIWTYRDSSLRGLDLGGFEVETLDGVVGRIERVATEPTGAYLVVDAGAVAPRGARVLLPAGMVDTVDLDAERVFVRLTRAQIRSAPAYDWQVPLDPSSREQFAEYYGARRSELGATPQPDASRQLRAVSEPSRTASPRARTAGGPSETSSERTKQELYEEAKKLGVEGRSKMSKAQLARAIERQRGSTSTSGSSAKANPVEVQKFLEGVGYPTGKRDLVGEAERHGASKEVRTTLERLPDKRFKTPTEVSEAIGKLR